MENENVEKRYFIVQKDDSTSLVTLYEVSAIPSRFPSLKPSAGFTYEVNSFRMEMGKVITSQNSKTLVGTVTGFIKNRLKHAKEVSAAEFELALSTTAKTLMAKHQESDTDKDYQLISWQDVKNRFQPEFLDVELNLPSKFLRQFCLYKGDATFDSDLRLRVDISNPKAQTEMRNIVVEGDLVINGNLDIGDNEDTYPIYIYIQGNLKAKNLFMSNWTELVVAGNVEVENIIFGFGEPSGSFDARGNVQAQHMFCCEPYHFRVQGQVKAKAFTFNRDTISGFSAQIIPYSISKEEWESKKQQLPLEEEVYSYDEYSNEFWFVDDKAYERLLKGKDIFKK